MNSNFWKKYFQIYDALNLVIPYQELLNDLCESLNIDQGDKILDVGSGTGNLSIKMKKLGADVVSLDNEKEALYLHKYKDPNSELINHNLNHNLPFKDGFFDKVVSNNVLYIISKKNRIQVLKELFRVLKKGGIIVLANPKRDINFFKIYLRHINKSIESKGYLKTFIEVIKMIKITIMMFYYNFKIKKENITGTYRYFEKDEQLSLLRQCKPEHIFKTSMSYVGQSFIDKAIK